MEKKEYKVTIEGTAPLLMHKFVGQSQLEGAKKSSQRGKKVYDPKEEAEKGAYRTDDGKLFLPSSHFKAAMVKAGVDFKMSGKKTYKEFIKSGIFIEPTEIILDQQEYEIFESPVVINRARVMSWRPQFKVWSCTFNIEIIDDFLNPTIVKEILETAGRFKGVGDYRPEFGRFKVVGFDKI